jgi:imidazolonepropionase
VENLAAARGAKEIDATGCVVAPGFVDSHSHLLFPPLRPPAAYEAEVRADEPADASKAIHSATAGRLEHRARAYVDAMARHGTTTVESKTGCGFDEAAELKLLRVMGALDGDVLDVAPTLSVLLDEGDEATLSERIDWLCRELLPKVQRRRLARFVELQWSAKPGREAMGEQVARATHELGLKLKVHDRLPSRPGGVRLGVEFGAISVDHLDHANDEDTAMLAVSGTMATLLPAASFHDGKERYAPGRELIDAGAAVALGSDFNPCLSPTLSMPAAIALACARLRMTAAEAITAATINGAYALGRGDRVGSLELGKRADIVILDIPDYREMAHYFGNNPVSMTIKGGALVYERGEILRSKLPPVA